MCLFRNTHVQQVMGYAFFPLAYVMGPSNANNSADALRSIPCVYAITYPGFLVILKIQSQILECK
jgi:nucleoside permease NupC